MSANGQTLEELISWDVGRIAAKAFMQRFGSEALVVPVSIRGRILTARFSGLVRYTCGVSDYFHEYAQILQDVSGSPYGIWNYQWQEDKEQYFLVRLVKLDFLGEIEDAIEEVGDVVKTRMKEFEELGKVEEDLFSELCFCILTANYTAEGGIKIQKAIGGGFCKLEEEELAKGLRKLGYRFPETRAEYIVEARRLGQKIGGILSNFRNGFEARKWFVKNVKGLGYKEASHFLRNVGFNDVAIIDRHILRYLHEKALLEAIPKSLNKTRYVEIERLLLTIGNIVGLTLGELDLYLWYLMTGKVLK